MNIPAVVVSLIGQAWAQTANGERRELRVGDRLRGDEVLVTAPGAQADLDFGNNRILSFVGEQSTPLDVAVAVTNKATPVPVLDAQGEAPLEPGAQAVSAQGSDSVSEGHNFVQLVRIGEIIEADGITPLSVARIKELLRPMGMSLPERDFEANEWREHWGTDSHSHSHSHGADADTDTRTPGLSIELQGAGPDGVYSAEEIGPDGTITAKIVLDDKVREGDILVVRDSNGNELLNRPVTAQDLLNGVVVEVPVSPGQGQVSVEAEVTTGSGLGGTDNDDKPVDNQVPVAAQPIVDRSDADMDPISLDLGSHFSDANQLTFNATGLPPGLSFDPVSGVVSGILDKSASQGVPGGEYQVTITATDAAGNSTSQTFTWTVDNPAPVAKDDNAVTAEDTPVSGNVLTGAGSDSPLISADSDPDGDSLSVVGFVVAGDSTVYVPGDTAIIPNVGSLQLNADGSYIFTPDKDWNGTVPSVTYTISDGEGGSATADLNIVVSPVNDAPTAPTTSLDQSNEDTDSITTVTLDLPKLFNDVDGDTLTYSIAGLPPGLIFDPLTGAITGTLDNSASQGGLVGEYQVTITATDASGKNTSQNFTWTVGNPAPVAKDDNTTTAEDTPVSGNVLTGAGSDDPLISADSDPDGDSLSVVGFVVAGDSTVYVPGDTAIIPNVGSLQLNADGSYIFTPAKDWNGTVPSVTYTISDGEGGSATADLNIVVSPVNDAPTALVTPPDQSGEDADSITPVTLDLPNLFNDVDGDTLTYSIAGLPPGLIFDPLTGAITGTLDNSASQGGPNSDGIYNVTLTATDPGGKTSSQTFTWTVGNPTPVANDDNALTAEDTPVSGNVLTGAGSDDPLISADRDPDGDSLSVVGFVVAGDSTVYVPGDTAIIPNVGSLQLNADGSYIFTPDKNWNGTVPSVTYTISDGEGGSATADLNIVVSPVNDTPTVTITDSNGLQVGTESIAENASAPVTGTFVISAPDGLQSIQVNGTTLTIADLEALSPTVPRTITGTEGTLTLIGYDAVTGKVSYSYLQAGTSKDHAGGDVTDRFTISVTDTDNDSSLSGDLVVQITDTEPLANADIDSISEDDASISGNVISTGSGADTLGADASGVVGVVAGTGSGELVSNLAAPVAGSYGSITIAADGTYTYTLNDDARVNALKDGETLTDTFSYTIRDADGDWSTTTITITIDGHTDGAPSIVAQDGNGAEITGQITVEESGLVDGDDSQIASASMTITAADGLQSITIGGTTVTLAQLEALGSSPITIITPQGLLTLTGFTATSEVGGVPTAGTLQYSYELTEVQNTPGSASNTETISLTVTDAGGEGATGNLVVNIIDDTPVGVDQVSVTVVEGGMTVGTTSGAANLLSNDDLGADGARVNNFKYLGSNGLEQESAVITAGGSITVTTQHGGSLTVYSDGRWSYSSPPASNSGVSAGHGQPGSGTDVNLPADFKYQLIDGDGDLSNWATQPIVVTDTAPTIDGSAGDSSVKEMYLGNGSLPDGSKLTAGGSLGVVKGADAINVTFSNTLSAPVGLASGGVQVVYAISEDGHTLTATAGVGGPVVFTVTINDSNNAAAGYEFKLSGALDHELDVEEINLDFPFVVTDTDGDTDSDSFTVTVLDDSPSARVVEVDEDSNVRFNTSADASDSTVSVASGNEPLHGTVTVNPDGSITYVPSPNYSGEDTFTYTTQTDSDSVGKQVTVTVTVKPLADAPTLSVDAGSVTTNEDTAIALGLNAPQVTDNTDQNGGADGDNPERLGMITLTGIPAGVTLLDGLGGDALLFISTGSPITIVLSDGQHITGLSGNTLTLTTAQYEALKALPATEDHRNFKVNVEVTSYEVDASGAPLPGVDGATSNIGVTVQVQAVTDPVELKINGADSYSLTIDEDSTYNLKDLLSVGYPNSDNNTTADVDGSETRWFEIDGLPVGSTVVSGGVTYTVTSVGQVINLPAPGLSTSATNLPDILVTPPKDYSGSGITVTITLKGEDQDADGPTGKGGVEMDSVTLDLAVAPKVDNLGALGVVTAEDTAVEFLQHLVPGDRDGSESITGITIKDIPAGWVVTDHNGSVLTPVGGELTVSGIDIASGDYLNYSIKPPAHSSLDATLKVDIEVTDQGYAGNLAPDVQTFPDVDLVITVTPEAERTDTNTAEPAGNDVTLTPGRDYTTAGEEDEWFSLGVEGAFNLKDGWNNEDSGSEKTFAQLTPELVSGDGSQADALGSQFRYSTDGGNTWVTQTYGGDPIEVPIEYLETLQFMASPNFSGKFQIKVEALTRDYDEDVLNGRPVDQLTPEELKDLPFKEEISGEGWLTNIVIHPVADAVTSTVNAHVRGNEDSTMALSIRPSSSDPSETFNVTISGIPEGATLTYNGIELTFDATGLPPGITLSPDGNGSWKVEIIDFDPAKGADMTVKPPLNSNDPFTLKVSTVSVDTLVVDGVTHESILSTPHELDILVSPKGVADEADVTIVAPADQTFTEAAVDSAGGILLNELITDVRLQDVDGSEALSFKIGGLPAGFSILGATLLGNGEWSLTKDQLLNAKLVTPPNFNGTEKFDFYVVTTEDDGNSLTQKHEVSVRVEPSPEATINLSARFDEDVSSPLDFSIQHRNGDTDEQLDGVWLKAGEIDGATDYSLTYGPGGESLADAVANGLPGIVLEDGWYKLSGSALNNIYAQGKENWHGNASFDVHYLITDPAADASVSDKQQGFDGSYGLTVNPVTDQPTLAVTNGADTTLNTAGSVIVNLEVGNTGGDYDGSEQLTRIIVDNVPEGVIVEGASYIGNGQWLLMPGTAFNGELTPELILQVNGEAANLDGHKITVTVITKDSGNSQFKEASTDITLTTTFGPGNTAQPAQIEQWEQTAFEPTEDTAFSLQDAVNARIEDGIQENAFTVTLTDLPAGTAVTGMTLTVIDGKEIWTASGTGGNAELQALLAGITVTPPQNWNQHDGEFTYEAELTTYVPNGARDEAALTLKQDVLPVTDDADILISAPTVDEGSDLAISIDVSNATDDPNWTLIDGKLYLTLTEPGSMQGGTLKDALGNPMSLQSVGGVNGVPDGDYYVIDLPPGSNSVDLVYTPKDANASGTIGLSGIVKGQELGSSVEKTTTVNTSGEIAPINSGYDFSVAPVTGAENSFFQATADRSNVIQLPVTGNGLVDVDGSESLGTILLKNLPDGFLVFIGDDAASATMAGMANNAGSSATGTNTWLLGNGEMPKYIGILPPAHWSGTLSDLQLIVNSGESALAESLATIKDFTLTVTPTADGIKLTPTASFGKEGEIILLNLNAEMKDLGEASAGAPDESVETATLQIKGLGEHAAFYLDGQLISGTELDGLPRVTYQNGVYTIVGLSQEEMGKLGFLQAGSAISDLQVRAQTVENGNPSEPSDWTHADGGDWAKVVAAINPQYGTTGNDRLLWTGQAINGRGGDDTIQLRFDEELSGSELAAKLSKVEVIDMTGAGQNSISGLNIADVLSMTDDRHTLRILGDDGDDSVILGAGWGVGVTQGDYTVYTATHGGETIKLEVASVLVD